MLGPSHVGIVCDSGTYPLLIESTTLSRRACMIRNRVVSGCQAHLPSVRIADYQRTGARVEVWRLSPIFKLSSEESRFLSRILITHFVRKGVTYDVGGALLSGTRAWRLFPRFGASLEAVFCSELLAAVLMRLGRLPVENPTKFNPSALMRTLCRSGVYRRTMRRERQRFSSVAAWSRVIGRGDPRNISVSK